MLVTVLIIVAPLLYARSSRRQMNNTLSPRPPQPSVHSGAPGRLLLS
jgi:hypothetical protein